MSLTIAATPRSNAIDGAAGTLTTLDVYSGSRPAGPGTAVTTQTKLATFTVTFGAASSGVKTLSGVPLSEDALADGTATWFRLSDASGARIDGKCSESGGGGDLILASTAITAGLTITITAGTLTAPPGTAD